MRLDGRECKPVGKFPRVFGLGGGAQTRSEGGIDGYPRGNNIYIVRGISAEGLRPLPSARRDS